MLRFSGLDTHVARKKAIARAQSEKTLPATRRVIMLGYPDAEALDIIGPLEVFSEATRLLLAHKLTRDPAYSIEVVGLRAGPFPTTSGVRLMAERGFRAVAAADLLMISGGRGCSSVQQDRAVLDWIRRLARRAQRVAAVCSGATILAQTGLLNGRSATTHWADTADLARQNPSISVRSNAIYVRDGKFYTSAGVTAGIDMALAIVEEDWGRNIALSVARVLVMFLNRPGGQSQFSEYLAAQFCEDSRVRKIQLWVHEHLEQNLSVATLAARSAMSSRNFARHFTSVTGMTPAHYVSNARLEAARRKLEENKLPTAKIAHRCGFGTAETMRRVFNMNLGVSPTDYRSRFS
jgi:transcriptional regulator GlxA family with amidase domain